MSFRSVLTLAMVCSLATIANATGDSPDTAALKRAATRGERIFQLDQAAWVGTDEMLRLMPDPRATGIQGWIVEEKPDHFHVIFYRLGKRSPSAAFVVDTRGRSILASHIVGKDENAGLTSIQIRMIEAREAASRQKVSRCTSGPMNTVVLPPSGEEEPIAVYILSSQARDREYPLGGHYEFDVEADGKVTSSRKFTNACVNLTAPENTVALSVSHLLDGTPTEIHVFTSLTSGLPLYVSTPVSFSPSSDGYRIWKVDGAEISLAPTASEAAEPRR